MGQQQLLLVILVTIIVGIATVVAINVFGSAADNAAESAVRQDLLGMAAAAQGYYMKPPMMAGGGNSFSGINFDSMGGAACNEADATNETTCTNTNGTYVITDGDQSFTITGDPASIQGTETLEITVEPDTSYMTDNTLGTSGN